MVPGSLRCCRSVEDGVAQAFSFGGGQGVVGGVDVVEECVDLVVGEAVGHRGSWGGLDFAV